MLGCRKELQDAFAKGYQFTNLNHHKAKLCVGNTLITIIVALLTGCANLNIGYDIQMPKRGVCAHRGASDTHPENTIAALSEAIRLGAQMIEFDIALSKDKQIILMHDTTIDRTTNGKGRVENWNLSDLKKLDAGSWKSKEFEDEKIPTLDQALDIMPKNIWLNIHLKGGVELAEKATLIIKTKGMLHQSLLACNNKAAIAAKKIDYRVKICNMERQANTLDYVNETISSNYEFIQLLGDGKVSPTHTHILKGKGIRINYCCTNYSAVLRNLFVNGVEFTLVDRLELMLKEADKLGIPRSR